MNQDYQTLLKELQEIQEKLLPNADEPTEVEHLKAKFRYFLDNVLFEKFHDLIDFFDHQLSSPLDTSSPQYKKIVERALQAKNDISFLYEDSEKDMWDKDIHTNEVMPIVQKSLTYMHGGNCTSFPSSCDRCYAEKIYRRPSTVTWAKEEGQILHYRLRELNQKRKSLEFANRLEHQLPISEELKQLKTKV